MGLMSQDVLGSCDFLDVLEEAAVRGGAVAIELRSGETFLDRIADVVTEGGVDWVDFATHARVAAREIRGCTRAPAAQR